jgi:hypothetical protein
MNAEPDLNAFEELGYIARHVHQHIAFWPCDEVTRAAKGELAVEATVENIREARHIPREAVLSCLLKAPVLVSHMDGIPACIVALKDCNRG